MKAMSISLQITGSAFEKVSKMGAVLLDENLSKEKLDNYKEA